MSNLVERLRKTGHIDYALLDQAADRIEELERQFVEAREASQNLHRRAQIAEGKLQRMEAAHEEACHIAFTKSIDYYLYAFILLNCNESLFPKLVNKGAVVPDSAAFIRNKALEEAAKIADDHAKSQCSGMGSETEAMRLGARSIASAIRALSDSSPTLLQEQNANSGKEEG